MRSTSACYLLTYLLTTQETKIIDHNHIGILSSIMTSLYLQVSQA